MQNRHNVLVIGLFEENSVDDNTQFVIPLSLVGVPENISGETVRRYARRLEENDEIDLQQTPTGRLLINFSGYQRLRQEILGPRAAAA